MLEVYITDKDYIKITPEDFSVAIWIAKQDKRNKIDKRNKVLTELLNKGLITPEDIKQKWQLECIHG